MLAPLPMNLRYSVVVRPYGVLPVLVLVAVLAACGSTGGDGLPGPSIDPRATPVRQAVEGYFEAVRAADGEAICARLAPSLRRRVARLQSRPCEQALAAEARRLPESLAGYRISEVELGGGSAQVMVEGDAGGRDEFALERTGGRWLITRAPGLGG
jgi:hypothetical protein